MLDGNQKANFSRNCRNLDLLLMHRLQVNRERVHNSSQVHAVFDEGMYFFPYDAILIFFSLVLALLCFVLSVRCQRCFVICQSCLPTWLTGFKALKVMDLKPKTFNR